MKQAPGSVTANEVPAPMGFRAKLTIAMMLVVCLATGVALYLAQRNAEAAYQQRLQDEFRARLTIVFGAQETRQAAVAERCRNLARSVRIRAALEEDDVEDLYANARVELRDVLDNGSATKTNRPSASPRATFFRFLNRQGLLYSLPGEKRQPWERLLERPDIARGNQQVGYIAVTLESGRESVDQVVCTPIIGEDGALLGTLVLGFPSVDASLEPGSEIDIGIWVDGALRMPGLNAGERRELSDALSKSVDLHPAAEGNLTVDFRGEPHLLFYKRLNAGSHFAPAYEAGLYSLASSIAEQRRLELKILGAAALALLIGLAASHFFSASLSKPVEQLAEDSAQNLARREEAETAREITEQKYQAIFENAVEGIFILAPDGRYLSANPAMARIFGFESPAAFLAAMVWTPEKNYTDPKRRAELLRRTAEEGTVSDFETEMLRKDGTRIWISQNARAARDESGAIVNFEGTLEDITERKRNADSLRALNAELEKALADLKTTQRQVIQQERLRALGQMASGIAHDFNNTLMPMVGFTDLLLVDPSILGDTKRATGYLEVIRTAAKDASSIVARLREFHRANEEGDVFQKLDLKSIAAQVVTLTQPKWKNQAQARGAEIRFETDLRDVPAISGDESALREALTNLIFNGVDAMPNGGTLTLRTFQRGEAAVIELSDTGAGMSEEVRERCMEPFFSTKGERGTGLGLAMVFGIIQRHEGTIDLRTRQGEGTTFEITFPPGQETGAAVGPDAPHEGQPSLRVLVVDDEPQAREVITAFLEHEGHKVQTAEHGVDGLARFLEGQYDLVITDKAMPGMNGSQMAAAIKQFAPRIPIVLLTGFHNTRTDEPLEDISFVVNKPITLSTLKETICQAMKTA